MIYNFGLAWIFPIIDPYYEDHIATLDNECTQISNSILLWYHGYPDESMDCWIRLRLSPEYDPTLIQFILKFVRQFGLFADDKAKFNSFKAHISVR